MKGKAVSGIMLTLLLIGMLNVAFNVAPVKADPEGLLWIETEKGVYASGEPVTITLTNIGDVYVEIGGWPCVMIYTYPELEPVWPTIFATLLWGLAPGESEAWIWNQYNEYTESPAEPGMYIVKFFGSLDPSASVNEWVLVLSEEGLASLATPQVIYHRLIPGSIFHTNITVDDVSQLHGYQFNLSYNTSILTAIDYGFYPPFELWFPSEINDAEGYVSMAVMTYMGDLTGLSTVDPVPIAWIDFIVDDYGTSVLHLHGPTDGSVLPDVFGHPIPHMDVDGFFANTVTLDIDPDTLNLKSEGKWITAYIELPEGYSVDDIDVVTILLDGTIPVDSDAPVEIGDYDEDGIQDLMLKFDRASVESFIYNQGIKYGEVALTMTGELFDGTPFEGTDIIFVNYAGDVNNDGIVNILDAAMVSAHWYPGPPIGPLGYDSNPDFNKDGAVDILDAGILSVNWGQTTPVP